MPVGPICGSGVGVGAIVGTNVGVGVSVGAWVGVGAGPDFLPHADKAVIKTTRISAVILRFISFILSLLRGQDFTEQEDSPFRRANHSTFSVYAQEKGSGQARSLYVSLVRAVLLRAFFYCVFNVQIALAVVIVCILLSTGLADVVTAVVDSFFYGAFGLGIAGVNV